MFVQLNTDWLNTLLVMVQLSVLALSNKLGLITAWPLADKYTLILAFGLEIGDTGSKTTTVVVPVFTFPLTSITVKVTVLIPKSAQVIVVGDKLTDAIPHISLLPLLTWLAVKLVVPLAPKYNTIPFVVKTVGFIVSTTVTVAVPVFIFPFTSVTVNVTVLGPTLEQLKLLLFIVIVAIPHASLLPLLTWETVIDVFPLLFK